jgi:hypothetical protein
MLNAYVSSGNKGKYRDTPATVVPVQRGGNSSVAGVALDHAGTVAIWVGSALFSGGISSVIGSACLTFI